jgi:predicted phosphodiesterase
MATKSAANICLRELIIQYPKAPALTLAKVAYRDHPELWANQEACRTMVRSILGTNGDHNRAIRDKQLYRTPRPAGWTGIIPEALVQMPDWKALVIDGPQKVLVVSDLHIPFHDSDALAIALDYGLKLKPTVVLLNGDVADHYAQSEYEKDPRYRDFPSEVRAVKQFLAGLRKCFGKRIRLIEKFGNHEERYTRYLRLKAPDLLGLAEFEWEAVFGLKENNIELVKDKRPIRLGDHLYVIHGHEYRFQINNPVNPARGFFLRAKVNVLGGHFHHSSSHSEKNLDGKVVSTFSTGCLCDLHPEYRPLNNWNHGFAWVVIDKTGGYLVDNLKIIGGKVF